MSGGQYGGIAHTPLSPILTAALESFGWTVDAAFIRRYRTDAWVFKLANAVERLTAERDAAYEAGYRQSIADNF